MQGAVEGVNIAKSKNDTRKQKGRLQQKFLQPIDTSVPPPFLLLFCSFAFLLFFLLFFFFSFSFLFFAFLLFAFCFFALFSSV